ncbi:MAG: helix-turn-helix domain-containing protein [Nitrospirae bacterium]|nr:helix-turn-helix domain-containing protein [Nitrospirota bacterium]
MCYFFLMDTAFVDNPTRKKILLALKMHGSMSVEDLSGEVNITPMGVRQHLLILERNGAVEYSTKKHGVGRPGFLYKLTETADNLFPKSYQRLALEILTDVENREGKEGIAQVFRRRRERIASETKRLLSGKTELPDRLRAFADLQQKDGFLVEVEESDKDFRLKQFNCTIAKVSLRFREACRQDLQLMRDIIGEDVVREQCLSDGDQCCEYVIPKTGGRLPE